MKQKLGRLNWLNIILIVVLIAHSVIILMSLVQEQTAKDIVTLALNYICLFAVVKAFNLNVETTKRIDYFNQAEQENSRTVEMIRKGF